MQRGESSKTPKQALQVQHKHQTDLSAWRKGGRIDPEKSVQSHQSPKDQKNDNNQGSLEEALIYFDESKSNFKVSYLGLKI